MKRPCKCLLILATLVMWSLASCSPGGSASNQINCSQDGEVCIQIITADSFQKGASITLQIQVTSTKDISDLFVTLNTPTEITVEGPQNWESNVSSTLNEAGLATWKFSIKADQTLNFNRVLHFPSHEGSFALVASVANVGRSIEGSDGLEVFITRNGGYIIRSGTPRPPYTPNVTAAAYGPGTPFPTLVLATYPWEAKPSASASTRVPPLVTTLTPTGRAPLVATPTPQGYPPPYP
jgi:hypothetical protein